MGFIITISCMLNLLDPINNARPYKVEEAGQLVITMKLIIIIIVNYLYRRQQMIKPKNMPVLYWMSFLCFVMDKIIECSTGFMSRRTLSW